MDFARFRELRGWTLERAASEMKSTGDERFESVSASLIGKHERGWHMPAPHFIKRYSEITEGAVTYEDWIALRDEASKHPNGRLPAKRPWRKSAANA